MERGIRWSEKLERALGRKNAVAVPNEENERGTERRQAREAARRREREFEHAVATRGNERGRTREKWDSQLCARLRSS